MTNYFDQFGPWEILHAIRNRIGQRSIPIIGKMYLKKLQLKPKAGSRTNATITCASRRFSRFLAISISGALLTHCSYIDFQWDNRSINSAISLLLSMW
jgi:hypothetical protein